MRARPSRCRPEVLTPATGERRLAILSAESIGLLLEEEAGATRKEVGQLKS